MLDPTSPSNRRALGLFLPGRCASRPQQLEDGKHTKQLVSSVVARNSMAPGRGSALLPGAGPCLVITFLCFIMKCLISGISSEALDLGSSAWALQANTTYTLPGTGAGQILKRLSGQQFTIKGAGPSSVLDAEFAMHAFLADNGGLYT